MVFASLADGGAGRPPLAVRSLSPQGGHLLHVQRHSAAHWPVGRAVTGLLGRRHEVKR